jgi:hypothetical protein
MVSIGRAAAAACVFAVLAIAAQAAEPLTGSRIQAFLASFTELRAFAEQRRIHFDRDRDKRRQDGSLQPFTRGLDRLRAAGAYSEATGIVRRHGFTSMESWAGTADRILRAHLTLSMQAQQPSMAAGMADAQAMIMNSPHLTPEQKSQALASLGASRRSMRQMQEADPADKAAVVPYRAQLDATFRNGRKTERGAGQHPGHAVPPPRAGTQGVKARLEKLKELYDAGLISRQEYDAKRAAILNQL